ncbi:AB hydrolase-1 domain-containing protein, partial [Nephila pilipes]
MRRGNAYPSSGCNSSFLEDFIDKETYVVDSRNHGESPWSEVFNFDCNVDDLLHLMDTINAPKAILIGHSMGGITAIKTALRAPERVESIAIEDIGVRRLPEEVIEMVRQRMSLMKVAVEKLPLGLDEVKARKFIFDSVFEALPPEIVKF